MVKNIAITGSYASGKSYILNIAQDMGYPIFSCDNYVKKLYKDQEIIRDISNLFPKMDVFDKQLIAEAIFSDKKMRKNIENIIHPKVEMAIKVFEQNYQNQDIIFTEVPLLFEKEMEKNFFSTIVVFCDENLRKQRALARNVNNEVFFSKISTIQMPQNEKLKRTDYAINTDNTQDNLKNELKIIIEKISHARNHT